MADGENYNEYYQFPAAMGIEYQGLSPFGAYGSDFNIFEVSGNFSLPLPKIPVLQPFVQVGVGNYDSRDYLGDGDKWDHLQMFGGIGMAYSTRFVRDFEIGGDVALGYATALFSNITENTGYLLPFFYTEVGGRIALDPSYNISVQIRPKLKYQYGFPPAGTEFSDFNGLSLGIGVNLQYRFGEDPDSAAALIRSLRFAGVDIPGVYAAMQSYYSKNPVGRISVENTEKQPLENLEVSFFQSGLMDAPTFCARIDLLEPGESREVELLASYNAQIFALEGITPFTGEIITTYEYRGRPVEQRQSASYDVHDKSALTWDDERKVAAFITPADSALRNYTSFIRQAVKDETVSSFNKPLQEAMQVFRALDIIGCLYQSDPTAPFTVVQENPQRVDSISLARDTLTRLTGDCDDLTVLYCSLLETLGIETAYITVPGHIFPAFNTGVGTGEYMKLYPDRSMFISLEGMLWVPVEITLMGRASFMEAWRKALSQWSSLDNEPGKRLLTVTQEAQAVFRPVGLRETDLGLQYGSPFALAEAFSDDFSEIQNIYLASYEESAKKKGRKQDFNRLGISYSLFGRYAEARRAFQQAVSLDRTYLPALVNSANLELISGSTEKAIPIYEKVITDMEKSERVEADTYGKLLLNLARAYFETGEIDKAHTAFARAETLVPEVSKLHSYLAPGDDALKASMPSVEGGLIFMEDEIDE
ncbi:MAG: hypothetical protein JW760_09010 [Spirochaetales bacterium]|nr:hypothetical protein [Spirochaetales bacterium]